MQLCISMEKTWQKTLAIRLCKPQPAKYNFADFKETIQLIIKQVELN